MLGSSSGICAAEMPSEQKQDGLRPPSLESIHAAIELSGDIERVLKHIQNKNLRLCQVFIRAPEGHQVRMVCRLHYEFTRRIWLQGLSTPTCSPPSGQKLCQTSACTPLHGPGQLENVANLAVGSCVGPATRSEMRATGLAFLASLSVTMAC